MPNVNDELSPTRVTLTRDGPILIDGPVEVVLDDGRVMRSDRVVVAVCACRRSRTYPWCDTSHRRRTRTAPGTTDWVPERRPPGSRPVRAARPPLAPRRRAGSADGPGPGPTGGTRASG
ncbi:CDGSH iron-sulfur domain-containing protein [Streptomyces sp. NPDC058864]